MSTPTAETIASFCNAQVAGYEKSKSMGPTSRRLATQVLSETSPPITAESYILNNPCGPGIVTAEIKSLYPDAAS